MYSLKLILLLVDGCPSLDRSYSESSKCKWRIIVGVKSSIYQLIKKDLDICRKGRLGEAQGLFFQGIKGQPRE